jgi:hypothetical protein
VKTLFKTDAVFKKRLRGFASSYVVAYDFAIEYSTVSKKLSLTYKRVSSRNGTVNSRLD